MGITDEQYVLLTTFKRDGSAVATPVWIVALGGTYLFEGLRPEASEPYLQFASGLLILAIITVFAAYADRVLRFEDGRLTEDTDLTAEADALVGTAIRH